MAFFRRNPFFYSVLFGLLAVCVAGLWYLSRLNAELSALRREYEIKSAQYDRYLAAKPSPTRSNLEVIEDNYRELYAVFEEAMQALNVNTYDRERFFGETPRSRADWSFELHKFKENARYAALSNGVELPSNVQFGFENFSDGGPPPENMQAVHEQIMIMSSLLETLFGSGIESFVRIQRGARPEDRRSGAVTRRIGSRLLNDGDEFFVAPGLSITVPGTIDSYVFRVAFRGQSVALRRFLNRIVTSPLPYVVRGVEVDLSSEGGEKQGLESLAENPLRRESAGYGVAGAGVPIISDNTSLFVVTLEFLELAVEVEPPVALSEAEGESDA